MVWIGGIAVVCIIVWLLVQSVAFRVFLLAAALIGAGAAWWFANREREESRLATEVIKPSELELSDVTLRHAVGTRRVISGRAKNLSATYTLAGFSLRLTAYDCPGQEITKECDIIGQADVAPAVQVPPGQVRSFDEYVSFYNMPPARHFRWSSELTGVRAQLD
jgi:hypothetical protein